MTQQHQQEQSARMRETSSNTFSRGAAEPRRRRGDQPAAAAALWPDARLSDAVAAFLQQQKGAERTRSETKHGLFQYLEFVAADFPIRELRREDPDCPYAPVEFLAWLSETPCAPRKAHSLPKQITPSTVAHFLAAPPPRRSGGGQRSEQRLGAIFRAVRPFFAWLGFDTSLPADERPNLDLPPPIVPKLDQVAAWWTHMLTAPGLKMANNDRKKPVSPALRRRGVLTQAFALLTGLRLGELIQARLADVEGPWLLIRETKTGKPRIIYQSPAALGLAAALRIPDDGQLLLFPEEDEPAPEDRVCGWPHTRNYWNVVTRSFGLPEPKPHQALRRACSDFLERRDPTAEAAQLGHGRGVVFAHYLDTLSRIPPVLDALELPQLVPSPQSPVPFSWTWPDPIVVDARHPGRLYEEFRRLVEGGGDRRLRRLARRQARQEK